MCFFPCFTMFIIPKTSLNVLVCHLFSIMLFGFLFFINRKHFSAFFLPLFKLKVIKIYILFLLYIIINTLVHYFMGYCLVEWYGNIFYFISFFSSLILLFLYPLLGIYLKLSIKTILKIIYIMIYITLLIGLIEWFALKYNITFINNIIYFFTNQRYGYDEIFYIKPRIHSLYSEPSILASFIFTIFPFVFNFYYLKNKLFKTSTFNLIFKLTLLPLTLIVLFLTESPVYIIVTIIEILLLLFIKYKNRLLNPKTLFTFAVIILFIPIITIQVVTVGSNLSDFSNTSALSRINIVFETLTDFEQLSVREESLATRIQSGIMHWHIFKRNPIFGVGINNSDSYALKIYYKVPIPLTVEMQRKNIVSPYPHLNFTILWKSLAESGIIGSFLYFWFFFNIVRISFKIKKYYQGIDLLFVESLQYSILTIALFSNFYNEKVERTIFWILYGLIFMFYYILKFSKQKNTLNKGIKNSGIQDR